VVESWAKRRCANSLIQAEAPKRTCRIPGLQEDGNLNQKLETSRNRVSYKQRPINARLRCVRPHQRQTKTKGTPMRLLWNCSFLVLLLMVMRAVAADGPVAKTEFGPVQGKTSGNGQINIFLGMPFAAPPVGTLRWKPPQPPSPWSEPHSTSGNPRSHPSPRRLCPVGQRAGCSTTQTPSHFCVAPAKPSNLRMNLM